MFGNLVNNSHLLKLVEERLIEFRPFFDQSKAQIAQYPLTVHKILRKVAPSRLKTLHTFDPGEGDFVLEPNDYVIVEIKEQIILSQGIVGRFIPSSNMIEDGLLLNAGKIEYPFGQKGQVIRFGLKNLLNESNAIGTDYRVAYIEFFDLRGLRNMETELTKRDKDVYSRRHPSDHDGEVRYPE